MDILWAILTILKEGRSILGDILKRKISKYYLVVFSDWPTDNYLAEQPPVPEIGTALTKSLALSQHKYFKLHCLKCFGGGVQNNNLKRKWWRSVVKLLTPHLSCCKSKSAWCAKLHSWLVSFRAAQLSAKISHAIAVRKWDVLCLRTTLKSFYLSFICSHDLSWKLLTRRKTSLTNT